ncbi:MAG: hypothetical protein DRQ46_10235 [Gammaproteobacteria bacterium]|nr:MAG: hypothetical protein DRQ46_10235 [Gammaproteobacteria bacterium]
MFQAPNVGVGGSDHGNREKKEYCYTVAFFDEEGTWLCTEPFTVYAYDSDEATCAVDDSVEQHCEEFGYDSVDITLEDVC